MALVRSGTLDLLLNIGTLEKQLDVERGRDAASRPTADTNLTHFPGR